MTEAHDGKVTHSYSIHYPSHPARTDDPHYADFNHYHKATHDTAKCSIGEHRNDFSECSLDKPLELHHAHIEFSLQNGVDLKWLEIDYPGVSNPDEVGKWVESAENLVWLCLSPDSPVLMADGSKKEIQNVEVGDLVIGGDGIVDKVIAHVVKPYSGDAYKIGSATLTAAHRVATNLGWVPVGEIANKIGMGGNKMLGLVCVQGEVDWSIVSPVPVDMMNAFGSAQFSTDDLFSYDSVCQCSVRVPHVALRSEGDGVVSDIPLGQQIEGVDSAIVGTVATRARPPMSRCQKHLTADFTLEGRSLALLPLDSIERITYNGLVHDITVAHSHSFIADGIVVHNCEFHHRGSGGVHVAAASDYEAEKYVRNLIGKKEING